MTSRSKKIIWLVVIVVVLMAAGLVVWKQPWKRLKVAQIEKEQEEILRSFEMEEVKNIAPAPAAVDNAPEELEKVTAEEEIVIKDKVLLDVQFIPQGPLDPGAAHWALHKESCEEAASLMAHNYAIGRKITMQEANDEIFELVYWQVDEFGDEHDIYADEVKQMLEGFYGHSDVKVIENATIGDLKSELSQGFPVIVPSIAKYLKNPRYYDQDYHMFLIVGYTQDKIIAHDNGTTWGENYPYPYDDFMQALEAAGGDVIIIRS
jgi:hypothetical protein